MLNSDRLDIPSLFHSDPLRRRILIALNIDLVVQHVLNNVTEQNTECLTPLFDEVNPIGATGQMRTWYTTKPCFPTTKSHISHLVGDSAWEGPAANVFEKREDVFAYRLYTELGQSRGPENIGSERQLPGHLEPGPVLSPSRITLETNEKIRPQPDRETASGKASGGGNGTDV